MKTTVVTVVALLPDGGSLLLRCPPWQMGERLAGVQQFGLLDAGCDHRVDVYVTTDDNVVIGVWKEYLRRSCKTPLHLQGRDMMLEHLKKAASKLVAKTGALEVEEDDFSRKYPALFCFMSANADGDGQLRERCKLQIFCEQGGWKCCLMDPGNEASLFVTIDSPLDACRAMEKALQAPAPDWRRWRKGGRRK